MGSFVRVDGLNTHYIEAGQGPAVLLLHGASLGSCTDVWDRTLEPLARHGLRVIAFDQPGYGLTDNPTDYTVAYRQQFILRFADALGLARVHLVGHSQAGGMALNLAFAHPDRVASVLVLGSDNVLPPLSDGSAPRREATEAPASEPTLADTRALLEDNLYHHELITPEVLAQRHRMSLGKNLEAARARARAVEPPADRRAPPLWQRLDQVPVPLLLVYGAQDRGAAAQRAALAKERYPGLDLRLIDGARHLVQWDAPEAFVAIAAEFLRRHAAAPAPSR